MTAAGTSKVEARRRAREVTRRANEARVAREKANIENAANYMVAKSRLAEIDAWEIERLAAVTEHVRTEADKRRAGTRAEACAALKLLQESGETLTTIAKLTGDGISEVRAMLRVSPNTEKPTARNGSDAVGAVSDAAPAASPGDGAAGVTDAASDERLPVGALGSGRDHATIGVPWTGATHVTGEGAQARLLPCSSEPARDD